MRPRGWSPEGQRAMRGEVDRLMAELLRRGRGAAPFQPSVDVYVSGEPPMISVELDAAGIDPDAVDVMLDGDVVVVTGERSRPTARRAYQHAEIEWGSFERRIRLPAPVDPDRVRATYDAGLLTIELPVAQTSAAGPFSVDVRRRGETGAEGSTPG